jgi:putative membrane protein
MLFVWKGSILKTILPQLVFMGLVSVVAWRTNGRFFGERVTISFTLIGVTLAVFLGFRNNVSYARYWEARQLLGHIATSTRSLMAQIVAYVTPAAGQPTQLFFMQHLIAFNYALNHQLRGREGEDFPTACCCTARCSSTACCCPSAWPTRCSAPRLFFCQHVRGLHAAGAGGDFQ